MSPTSPGSELARAHERSGLAVAELARALGVARGTVRAWLAGTSAPQGVAAERVAEFVAVVDRLCALVVESSIGEWLLRPSPALGERCPVDALGAGDYRDVSRLLAGLESPTGA